MALITNGSTFLSLNEHNDKFNISLSVLDKLTNIRYLTIEYCLYDMVNGTETPPPGTMILDYSINFGTNSITQSDLPYPLDPSREYNFVVSGRLILLNNVEIPQNNVIMIKNICVGGDRNINAC